MPGRRSRSWSVCTSSRRRSSPRPAREADTILSRTREDANRFRDELKQKAQAEAAVIVKNAERQIEMETARALQQIRTEAVDFSVAIASKILQRNVSKEDNERLIEETFRQIEVDPPQLTSVHDAPPPDSLPIAAALVGGLRSSRYAIRSVGWTAVLSGISRVGWGLLPILALAGLRFVLRAAAWRLCMPPHARLTARSGVRRVSRGRCRRQRHTARPVRQRADQGLSRSGIAWRPARPRRRSPSISSFTRCPRSR